MTLKQEAIELIQEQPNENMKTIIKFLKDLKANSKKTSQKIRKFGIGKDVIELPDVFFEHFDDMNDEIATMFYGED